MQRGAARGFNYPCWLSGEVDVDREERFHSRHLSRRLASSRGTVPAICVF